MLATDPLDAAPFAVAKHHDHGVTIASREVIPRIPLLRRLLEAELSTLGSRLELRCRQCFQFSFRLLALLGVFGEELQQWAASSPTFMAFTSAEDCTFSSCASNWPFLTRSPSFT